MPTRVTKFSKLVSPKSGLGDVTVQGRVFFPMEPLLPLKAKLLAPLAPLFLAT